MFGESDFRVFRNAWFGRFARKEKISAAALWEAVERAEGGLIDADLGGGVIQQHISRSGAGKSSGCRSILIDRKDGKAFFVFGFPKNAQGNIRNDEEAISGYFAHLRPRGADKPSKQGATWRISTVDTRGHEATIGKCFKNEGQEYQQLNLGFQPGLFQLNRRSGAGIFT